MQQSIGSRQRADPELKIIIDYQEEGILPSEDKKAREILLSRNQYHMIESVLYYIETDKSVCLFLQNVIVENCLRKLIVEHLVLI